MGRKIVDLTGMRFGEWTVIEKSEIRKNGYVTWLCECSCINKARRLIRGDNLRNETSKSCGCVKYNINMIKSMSWKYKIGQNIKDDKRNFTIIGQFHNKDRRYNYKCNRCGWDKGTIRECHIDSGQGCGCCSGHILVTGINDIPTKAPWMVELIKGGYGTAKNYTLFNNSKIDVICPYCYKEKSMKIYNLYFHKKVTCTCGDGKSYPEKFMSNILDQLEIVYKWGYRSEWLKGYNGSKRSAEFDFFLPTYNLFIEMDGGIGHGNETSICKLSGITPEQSISKDRWKDAQAVLHGYKVFRIDSTVSNIEHLKYELCNTLCGILDLSNIDWLKCDISGLKNIVKDVANYYMKHKPISTIQIANIFNISAETALKYLKSSAKHGWCDYSVESAKKLANQRCVNHAIDNCSKRVRIYKNDMLLGEYPSVINLSRNSIEDFGVILHASGIGAVACNKLKTYKGYMFKYAM